MTSTAATLAPPVRQALPPARKRRMGAALGPGLVFALSTIGVGDFVANSAVGAEHGYQFLWLLVVGGIFRFAWLRASANYTLVTGETLIQGYARVGTWLVWVVLIAMTVVQHFYNLFKYPLFGQCLNMVAPLGPHGVEIWALLTVCATFALLWNGGYARLERTLRTLVFLLGVTLVVAAAASHPDGGAIARGLLVPSARGGEGTYGIVLLAMAVIGTELGTTVNISYSYFLRERGWRTVEDSSVQQRDLLQGVATMFVVAALLQIVAAGTLFGGPPPQDVPDLVRLSSVVHGSAARYVVGLGLWSAAVGSTLGIISGTALIVTDMSRNVLPGVRARLGPAPADRPAHADPVYKAVILVWLISPLYVFVTSWKPVFLGLLAGAMGLVVMPLMSLALLKITNDRTLMGERKNGVWTNAGLILIFLVTTGFLARAGWDFLHARPGL